MNVHQYMVYNRFIIGRMQLFKSNFLQMVIVRLNRMYYFYFVSFLTVDIFSTKRTNNT